MPKIAMRAQSLRVRCLGDEARAASPDTASVGRGKGSVTVGPCGLVIVAGVVPVSSVGDALGSGDMGTEPLSM